MQERYTSNCARSQLMHKMRCSGQKILSPQQNCFGNVLQHFPASAAYNVLWVWRLTTDKNIQMVKTCRKQNTRRENTSRVIDRSRFAKCLLTDDIIPERYGDKEHETTLKKPLESFSSPALFLRSRYQTPGSFPVK